MGLESWDERDEGAERGLCGGIRRVPLGTRRGLALARATSSRRWATMFLGTVGGLGSAALPVDIVAGLSTNFTTPSCSTSA